MTTTKARKSSLSNATAWGVVLASGRSSEFGADIETVFLTLGSKPILTYSLSAFERCTDIEGLVLVTSKERLESLRAMVHMFGCPKVKSIIAGPANREEAVLAGLNVAMEHHAGIVTVHDGARPGVTSDLISETVRLARKHGAAAVATPLADPVGESAKGAKLSGLVEGAPLYSIASPQSFSAAILHKALTTAAKKKLHPADEATAVAALKQEVHLAVSKRPLVRIASPVDLTIAEVLLKR
ncbi:MAG TPA: 2-C-methyl-D-erythritol 4-phosphate cytidylyltransferase [Kiritimatiellia bacterium]|nr:2-C-methyl-D-erythritol 4-phosphate cytidylyltransferase [Kiritimatiellia bacterium]